MAVVLNCRKLASTDFHPSQYITSLAINLFPDISTHPPPKSPSLYCAPPLMQTNHTLLTINAEMSSSSSSKILIFIVIANRFGQGRVPSIAETPWRVISLYPAARPTTSLYLTRHPHCPRLLLRGSLSYKDCKMCKKSYNIQFGVRPSLLKHNQYHRQR